MKTAKWILFILNIMIFGTLVVFDLVFEKSWINYTFQFVLCAINVSIFLLAHEQNKGNSVIIFALILSNICFFFAEDFPIWVFLSTLFYIIMLLLKKKRFTAIVAMIETFIMSIFVLMILFVPAPENIEQKIWNQNGDKAIVVINVEAATVSANVISVDYQLISELIYLRKRVGTDNTGDIFASNYFSIDDILWINDTTFKIGDKRFNIWGMQIK